MSEPEQGEPTKPIQGLVSLPEVKQAKSIAETLKQHFAGLLELAQIEAQEFARFVGGKLIALAIALASLTFFYLILLVGLTGLLAQTTPLAWFHIALIFSGLHLAIGLIALLSAKRKPKEPLFSATIDNLKKDRECLSNQSENKK